MYKTNQDSSLGRVYAMGMNHIFVSQINLFSTYEYKFYEYTRKQ